MKPLRASAAFLAVLSGTLGAAGTASAADPSVIGDWMVKDGYGIVRIDNCNGKMWGIIAWEKKAGTDKENPDPAKKGRPTLGVPIIIGMAPTQPNRWEGEIYNTENGKNYSGSISLADENTLNLEGCLFPNFLCGGQRWTRMTSLPADGVALPPSSSKGGQQKGPASKKGAAPASEVCQRVAADEAALNAKAASKRY